MNNSIVILHQQASAMLKAGKHAQAAGLYRKLLSEQPDDLTSLINLGTYQIQCGETETGLALIEKALKIAPNNTSALNTQANALKALKRYAEALASYDLAIKQQPDFADAWANRGNTLRELAQPDAALQSYNQALALKPEAVNFLNSRALLYKDLQRFDEALLDFKTALRLQPNSASTHFNLANFYVAINSSDLALQHFNHALEINPQYAAAYNNRSNLFKSLNDVDAALQDSKRAIEIQPDYVEAHWNQALLYLLKGDYLKGWDAYEWRWRRSDRSYHQHYQKLKRWTDLKDIAGKNIVLHAEQGFGDTIQFCRYAPIIAELGANVYLDVPPTLRPLLKSLGENIHVLGAQDKLLKVDLHSPLMSMPWIFKHDLHEIPARQSYLFAAETDVNNWSQKLGVKQRKRVGLAWAGNPNHTNDKRRSLALAKLKPILAANDEFHSLQKDMPPADDALLAELANIHCWQHDLKSFADTAALISNMDLVICIDSAVAHLAGALGCPTWLLLPHAPDFRWMLARDDSPWYPSMRIFRQQQADDWDGVVESVVEELKSFNKS
jgi:hypothetical protein